MALILLLGPHYLVPQDAQAVVSVILWVTFYFLAAYIPKYQPDLWQRVPTRAVVPIIGVAALTSTASWLLERAFPESQLPHLLTGPMLHTTALVVTVCISLVLALTLPNLHGPRRYSLLLLLLSSIPCLAACLLAASAIAFATLSTGLLSVLDLRCDTSFPAIVYRVFINAAPIPYLLLQTWVLGESYRKEAGGPAMSQRSRYLSLAPLGLALVEADVFLLPLVGLFWPESYVGANAPGIARVTEVPCFLLICYGCYRGFAVPRSESPAEGRLKLFDAYRSFTDHVSSVRRGTSPLHPRHWSPRFNEYNRILEETLRLSGVPDQTKHAKEAFALVAALNRSGNTVDPEMETEKRLTRGQLRCLTWLHGSHLGKPPSSRKKHFALANDSAELAQPLLLITNDGPASDLSAQAPWVQAVALLAAYEGFLPPKKRYAMLERSEDFLCKRVVYAFHSARALIRF